MTDSYNQRDINLLGENPSTMFLLQNATATGALAVTGAGVAFPWDQDPIIDDAGDWSWDVADPTEILCVRAGRYLFEYGIPGTVTTADAYVAVECRLDGNPVVPGGFSQFQVPSGGAVTFVRRFTILNVNAGQIVQLFIVAFPDVTFDAGGGSSLAISRV